MADSRGNTLWHQVYEPYGLTHLKKDNANSNKFSFAGKELDSTDLSYFSARYYSANQARFMSPDPVDVQPDNPNTFNRYVYANNNPYKYEDRDGKFAWVVLGLGITAYDTYNAYQGGGINAAARHLASYGAITVVTGGAFKVASKVSSKVVYAYYMRKVEKLDVSTARNSAVFYSGTGNRQLAEEFARASNKTTLEMTKGGKWLDDKQLYTKSILLENKQADNIWSRLSERYAENASGSAFGFVQGARSTSIFNTIESPTLFNNSNVTNVITGGF